IMMRILNNLSDLRETRFGQPCPRHGLKLLWWFAHDCVQIDSNGRMTAQCDPANGAFGFHQFYNVDGLLPKTTLPYYELGNLNTPGSLPHYVTENCTGYSDSSNTDRNIVSFKSSWSSALMCSASFTFHSMSFYSSKQQQTHTHTTCRTTSVCYIV
uniref:Uncharacterized protein n=1 Tax=Sinocyclocheilus anshuiensis TaxID=1608454 RepID=A0A671R5Q5_9TELE